MNSSPRLTVVLVFLGALLVQCGWIIATPPYRGMDEFDHAYRAEAVAAGHWGWQRQAVGYHGRGDLVRVRAATVRAAYPVCHSYDYVAASDCRPVRAFADGTVLVASGAARYQPVFYALVGVPTRWLDPVPALYVMRVLDALVCSLLVALAVWATTLWSRSVWPLVAILLACTPEVMYSGSTLAPNGPEMFAGLALWSLLLGLTRLPPLDARVRRLLLSSVVPGVVLATARTLGPLWLALVVLSSVGVLGVRPAREVIRARARLVTVVAGVVATATLAGLLWSWSNATNSPGQIAAQHETSPVWKSLRLLALWVPQTIGVFPDKFDLAPYLMYAAALAVMGGLLVAAWRRATVRTRTALLAVSLVSVALPFAFTVTTYATLGPVWQGRYTWPYACGVLLVAGLALDAARVPLSRTAITWSVLVGLLLVQLPGPVSLLLDEARSGPMRGSSAWWLPYPGVVAGLVVSALLLWLVALLRTGGLTHAAVPLQRGSAPARVEEQLPSRAPVRAGLE